MPEAATTAARLAQHRTELSRNILAGSCAISIAVGTFNPLDTLRIRWQVAPHHGSARAGGLVSHAREIVRTEGLVRGLWTPGLGANMMSFFVCGGLRQGLYPYFRDLVVVASGAEDKGATSMMLGGFGAGAIAFWCCTPFFQLKTLMQAEAGQIDRQSGRLTTGAAKGSVPRFHGRPWWSNASTLMAEGGVHGLWRGACPLVVRGALLASGQMLGYDGMKTHCKREVPSPPPPAAPPRGPGAAELRR